MIKSITQYVVFCDNSFCDAVDKSVVDFHSYDRQQQFEKKIKKLGWKVREDENKTGQQKNICPSCLLFTLELEKKTTVFRPIRKSA